MVGSANWGVAAMEACQVPGNKGELEVKCTRRATSGCVVTWGCRSSPEHERRKWGLAFHLPPAVRRDVSVSVATSTNTKPCPFEWVELRTGRRFGGRHASIGAPAQQCPSVFFILRIDRVSNTSRDGKMAAVSLIGSR